MLKLTLRNLWAHKLRLLTSALAVVLGVAFLTGTLVITSTLSQVFDDLFADVYRGTDALVRTKSAYDYNSGPTETSRLPLQASLIDRVRAVPGVADVVGNVGGNAQLVNTKNKIVSAKQSLTFGYNWTDSAALNPYRLTQGRAPKADDEIVVDAGMFKRGKLSIGDRVKVITPGPITPVTLVGVATFGKSDSAAGSSAVFFTTPTAQRLLGRPGDPHAHEERAIGEQ